MTILTSKEIEGLTPEEAGAKLGDFVCGRLELESDGAYKLLQDISSLAQRCPEGSLPFSLTVFFRGSR